MFRLHVVGWRPAEVAAAETATGFKKDVQVNSSHSPQGALESPLTVYSGSRARLNSELLVGDSIEHAGGCILGQGTIWGCLVGKVRNLGIIRSCPEDVSAPPKRA